MELIKVSAFLNRNKNVTFMLLFYVIALMCLTLSKWVMKEKPLYQENQLLDQHVNQSPKEVIQAKEGRENPVQKQRTNNN